MDSSFNPSNESLTFPELATDEDTDDEGPFFDLEFPSPDENADNNPPPAAPLLKSATKFRVFILKRSKFLFIKLKVEDAPLLSLFTREASSRNQPPGSSKNTEEEKMKSFNSKEKVQKYFSKIKPLYVRVSKRYADKLKFSGPLGAEGGCEEEKEEVGEVKMGERNLKMQLPAKLKVVYERLGKSNKSAATSVVAEVSLPKQQRRDDSLLQQQDGIQSAIAHCKRSFTATTSEGVKA